MHDGEVWTVAIQEGVGDGADDVVGTEDDVILHPTYQTAGAILSVSQTRFEYVAELDTIPLLDLTN